MKAISLKDIKQELIHLSPNELQEICLRLSRFKKENKELLSYLLFHSSDEDAYIESIKKLIDEGVDVLVVVPCDAMKASEIPKMAQEAGIPTISYDRLIMSRSLSLYISYDNEKVGELQAEYVIKKVPKGNYILINGPTSDNNSIQFRKGQLKVLQKHIDEGNIKILEDYTMSDWSEIEALMKMDEFLSVSEVKPDVIIAGNDALANGSIEALKSHGIEGTVAITGQDADLAAIKNIIAGNQSMTIYKPIKTLAHLAAENAMKLAKGESLENLTKVKHGAIEVDAILLAPVSIDKSNYKETVVKDGHILETDL